MKLVSRHVTSVSVMLWIEQVGKRGKVFDSHDTLKAKQKCSDVFSIRRKTKTFKT